MERWRGRPQNAPKVHIFISIKIAHNLKEFWLAELYLWNFRGRPVNLVCPTSQLEGYSLARVSFQLLWWGWGFFWMMMRFCKMSRLRLIFDDQILVQQLCNSMRCKYTLGAASKADGIAATLWQFGIQSPVSNILLAHCNMLVTWFQCISRLSSTSQLKHLFNQFIIRCQYHSLIPQPDDLCPPHHICPRCQNDITLIKLRIPPCLFASRPSPIWASQLQSMRWLSSDQQDATSSPLSCHVTPPPLICRFPLKRLSPTCLRHYGGGGALE